MEKDTLIVNNEDYDTDDLACQEDTSTKMTEQEKKDFLDGNDVPDNQVINPWSIKIEPTEEYKDYKKEHPIEQVPILNKQLHEDGCTLKSEYDTRLQNLSSIIADVVAGNAAARERPEFVNLNFPAIKAAIEWLIKTNQISNTGKADLMQNAWMLNFKAKPPTPKEFITEKYIGDQANSLYPWAKDIFAEYFDPLKPYRTLVLTQHIGSGKAQPYSSKVAVDRDDKRKTFIYKNIGDLSIGDEILATDGKKRKIFSIQEQGESDIYEIIISDGRSFRTHLKHLTPVCFRKNKENRYVWDNLTTEWMMNHLNDFHFAILTEYSELDIYDKLSLFLEHENEPDDNIIPIVKEGPYITEIKKLDYKEKCRCITMMDPDGQYYTDNGIITHNSTFSTLAQLFISVHYALMWHPYKFFGLAPSSIFTQCMGGWNQKKASELLVEPFVQILECSPYFQRVRTHHDLTEASAEEVAECLHWTTSSPTAQPLDSKVYLPDGTYKLMKDVNIGDIIASPTTGSVQVTAIPFEDEADCYEIELEDGRTVRCSNKHLWKVRRSPDSDWEVRDLEYIMSHPEFEWEIIETEDLL